jgi:hypothetical protein
VEFGWIDSQVSAKQRSARVERLEVGSDSTGIEEMRRVNKG